MTSISFIVKLPNKTCTHVCFIVVVVLCFLFVLPVYLFGQSSRKAQLTQGSQFSFQLKQPANTSAGVYTKDSILVRTLWSGKKFSAGKYTNYWDGRDDEGNLVESGTYYVKVLSNNVTYTWEGVIGNTSDSLTGPTVYNGYGRMNGMVIVGNTAFFSKAYSEGSPSYAKFNINNPQQRQWVGLSKPITLSTLFVASDGANVYWSNVFFRDTSNCFVTATKVVDDAEVIFNRGPKFMTKWGGEFKSVIDFYNGNSAVPTGLAVQKKGKYLIVAHGLQNRVDVLDKFTGELIRVISVASPAAMAVDNEDALWISFIENGVSVVKKFTILGDGQLSAPILTLKGVVEPLALAVAPNNAVLVVADGGTNQQLKAFNNESGNLEWVFGKQGGYFADPAVGVEKFYFTDKRQAQIIGLQTFIAFEPNGSFWVEDAGNARALHYTADRKFINQIMYLPSFYSCVVDPNNPSRVFADYLEFKVDYSKQLLPNNQSWTLVNNWGATVPDSLDDHIDRFMSLTTLKNERTYAFLNKLKTGAWQLVELPKEGPLRLTGIEIPGNLRHTRLHQSGDLRTTPRSVVGKPLTWTQKKLSGFDNVNNPIWGNEEVFAQSPPFTKEDPANWGYGILHAWDVSTSGALVSFDNGLPPGGSTGYHLGGLNPLTGKWLWKTARATSKTYSGEYPADGAYDIGNSAQYGGNLHLIYGHNIFWGYHGEFWKGNQVNKWNHVWDDGLFLGQFGATGLDDLSEAPPRMAGNVLGADLVKGKNGEMYLYHNDEGRHGGIHRWKIDGLNTISEQVTPVTLSKIGNGLFAITYTDTTFNNASIESSGVLLNTNIKAPKSVASSNAPVKKVAVKVSGFVKPVSDGLYYFGIDAITGTKLVVNGQLLANNLLAKNSTDSGGIFLNAGKQYPISINCIQTDDASLPQLYWRSNNFAKQPVPLSQLTPDLSSQTPNGVMDLMEGLRYNTIVQNGQYGWTRNPVSQDSTNKYTKWWSVATGVKKYQKLESPDIYIVRKQDTGVAFVFRKFSNNQQPIKGWRLHGQILFDKNLLNRLVSPTKDVGGCYFEILDKNGKILLRFYPTIMNYPNDIRFYVNNQTLLQSNFNDFRRYIEHGNNIDVQETDGKLILQFENLPPITVDRYDLSSSLEDPQSMGMYFWGRGGNTVKVVDLVGFVFEP